MEILPTTSVVTLIDVFQGILDSNVLYIIAAIGLAVGIVFVTRWFTKSTNSIVQQSHSDWVKYDRRGEG